MNKETVTIWIAEGEMKEGLDLSKPFTDDYIMVQKHVITFTKKWLKERGYKVKLRPNHAINTVYDGISKSEQEELYDALSDADYMLWDMPIDSEVNNIINEMVL